MKHSSYRSLASLFCIQTAMLSSILAGQTVLPLGGLNSMPGWALNRIGQQFSVGSTYAYPETTTPVRLYLIDTAVSQPQSFVDANRKLTFEGPYLISGANDPKVSTPREHGTQMLSLIAGIDTGVAPGTPIHVVNYDIYPKPTTTLTLLASAIIQAVQHHRDSDEPQMRSVICIATSSAEQAESQAVSGAIDFALSEGITVVLSAGNLGEDASTIAPSSNGIKNGVICVGASDMGDGILSDSNYGPPVDLLAPGVGVPTRSINATSPIELMLGTSPAAALVTGAVLAKLSASPTHTPAGIESSLKAASNLSAANLPVLRSIVPPSSDFLAADVAPDGPVTPEAVTVPLTWEQPAAAGSLPIPPPGTNAAITHPPAPDLNGDGIPDMVSVFHGASTGLPPVSEISLSSENKVHFKFAIDSDLFDGANPFVLRNGYTWQIKSSSCIKIWGVPRGQLLKSTVNGRAYLTAVFPAVGDCGYAQIEITAPPKVGISAP